MPGVAERQEVAGGEFRAGQIGKSGNTAAGSSMDEYGLCMGGGGECGDLGGQGGRQAARRRTARPLYPRGEIGARPLATEGREARRVRPALEIEQISPSGCGS